MVNDLLLDLLVEHYESILQGLTAFVAGAILVSGLDDFFIDVCHYFERWRRWTGRSSDPSSTEEELRALPEQAIAVMVPAWHEDAVIAKMLRNTLRTVDYKNFTIFVGTYPNDEATMMAVAEVAQEDPRVRRVVCPHDGPTNKADCLNWIIEGIRQHDKSTGKNYRILMLHDCEDLVHPLSFRLMNRYIPGSASMVQLPVIPFESKASELTAGTYLDEFAESHLKDMPVRQRLSGMVPSAGVGTGFSRDAIERLAEVHDHQVFNVGTFTEDYDLAFRLNAIGERSILVHHFVEKTRAARGGESLKRVRELVGTREYFPGRFKDAVRQKARWTLGIVFHGWKERGWEGGLALRYMVWRDRKTLFTNAVNMVGYLLLVEGFVSARLGLGWPDHGPFQHIPPGSLVWEVILLDTALLGNRCVQRVIAIATVSSWRQAALSLPRIVWGNVINFFAVARAAQLFVRQVVTGRKPVWAKTAHAFPSEEQLLGFKRKLGDLLLEAGKVSLTQLTEALKAQPGSGRPLGELLVELGFAAEGDVVDVLGAQLKLDVRRLDPATPPPPGIALLDAAACRARSAAVLDAGLSPLLVGAARPEDPELKRWLDASLTRPYRVALVGRRNLAEALDSWLPSDTVKEETRLEDAEDTGRPRD